MPIVTKEIEVPSEPGLRVTIRKLSYWQAKQAKDARFAEVRGLAKDAAGFREMLGSLNPELVQAARARAEDDPSQAYDMQATLHAGIVAWNYPEDPKASNIDDLLAPDPAEFIFREIVAFTERSADEKKDSAPSSEPTLSLAALEDGPSS